MVCKMSDQRLAILIEAFWEFNRVVKDHFHYLVRVIMHEGTPPHRHFIQKDTQAVPVNCFTMAFILNDFWSEILGGAAKGVGSFIGLYLFEEAEVR